MWQTVLTIAFMTLAVWNWQSKWHCMSRDNYGYATVLTITFMTFPVWNWQPMWCCMFRDTTVMWHGWPLQTFVTSAVWNWQSQWLCLLRDNYSHATVLTVTFMTLAVWSWQSKWHCVTVHLETTTVMWQCWPLQTTVTWAVWSWQLRTEPCPSWSACDWMKTSSPGNYGNCHKVLEFSTVCHGHYSWDLLTSVWLPW